MDSALIESLLQRLVTGVLVGSIYGLLCTGLGMIFGVIRVINFAQGEFMMLGMYITLFVGAALAGALARRSAARVSRASEVLGVSQPMADVRSALERAAAAPLNLGSAAGRIPYWLFPVKRCASSSVFPTSKANSFFTATISNMRMRA